MVVYLGENIVNGFVLQNNYKKKFNLLEKMS